MSASLVGSEMCIRDSHHPTGRPQLAPPALARVASFGGSRGAVAPRPVSYTRLTLPTICSV
eukprot:5891219-Alexandrium_andersonii.AAC.1